MDGAAGAGHQPSRSRLPAKTPCGSLPPLFPTSPPQQDVGPRSGTAPATTVRRQAGRRGGGDTTEAPSPLRPHGSSMVSPPHPHFLPPPSHPGGPAARRSCRYRCDARHRWNSRQHRHRPDQRVLRHPRLRARPRRHARRHPARQRRPARQAGQPLRKQLRRIEAAQDSHVRELDELNDPAARAWRARIRQRFAELEAERTQAAALDATSSDQHDPGLLDELPISPGLLDDAPPRVRELLPGLRHRTALQQRAEPGHHLRHHHHQHTPHHHHQHTPHHRHTDQRQRTAHPFRLPAAHPEGTNPNCRWG